MTYRFQVYANETIMSKEFLKEFEDDRYRCEEEQAIMYAYELSIKSSDVYCVALWRRNPDNKNCLKLIAKFYN